MWFIIEFRLVFVAGSSSMSDDDEEDKDIGGNDSISEDASDSRLSDGLS